MRSTTLTGRWSGGRARGADELAFRTTKISREHCRRVAEYAFVEAGRTRANTSWRTQVHGIQGYEGMLKEEMDAASLRHPDVRYEPQLIDATFALILTRDDRLVIPALNRDRRYPFRPSPRPLRDPGGERVAADRLR